MVRSPCCEKMGLKKGPWTSEEDQILINYINLYGHGNWRALPKQAGLLRCGKSCRLRWTNYLRPDIKRGNFSREEEDTIIELHEMLGNRWSAIAARLPGRTDNEIKNVWHTHLKKRLIKQNYTNLGNHNIINRLNFVDQNAYVGEEDEESFKFRTVFKPSSLSTSSPHCSSDTSSIITVDNNNNNNNNDDVQVNNNFSRNLPESDDNFWLEVLSNDQYNGSTACFSGFEGETQVDQFHLTMQQRPELHEMSSNMHETMDFWYHVFSRGGELPELKEII